jgi:hypothetical protein
MLNLAILSVSFLYAKCPIKKKAMIYVVLQNLIMLTVVMLCH